MKLNEQVTQAYRRVLPNYGGMTAVSIRDTLDALDGDVTIDEFCHFLYKGFREGTVDLIPYTMAASMDGVLDDCIPDPSGVGPPVYYWRPRVSVRD
jgi:hypothetical protein